QAAGAAGRGSAPDRRIARARRPSTPESAGWPGRRRSRPCRRPPRRPSPGSPSPGGSSRQFNRLNRWYNAKSTLQCKSDSLDCTPMEDQELITQAIASNVRAQRAHRGLTLDALAARSGVSRGMLVQVEQGRTNPSVSTLTRIASALGVTVARLVEVGDVPMV